MAAGCIDRIDFSQKGLLVTLLCLMIVLGYSAEARADTGATVTTGAEHTLFIKPDGTLWAWGYNFAGQLGDGTAMDKHTPVQVGSSTDWAAVTAGRYHTLASIAGKYISVWAYINGQWKSYAPNQPYFSDLNNVTPGVGYLLKTAAVCTWELP